MGSMLDRIHNKTTPDIIRAIVRRILKVYPSFIISHIVSCCIILFLYLIDRFYHIRVGLIITQRIGHLALNMETFARKKNSGWHQGNRHILIAGKPCNVQLLKMWKRNHNIIESNFLYELFWHSLWLWKKTKLFEPLEMFSNEYQIFQDEYPTLEFTNEEEEIGKKYLKKMGINQSKNWFVCIFARDTEYLKNIYPGAQWDYHNFRNSDIDKFIPAIKYIIDKGGYVVRVGHHVNKPVNFAHSKFIDYSLNFRNDFMDIYLMAKCRFVLGTTSGICDVAMIFDRPRVGVNWVPIGSAPWGKQCLYIPKKLRGKNSKKYIFFTQFIHKTKNKANPLLWYGNLFYEAGYEYENNTPEEILDATKEMVARLEGTWHPSEENQKLLKKYYQAFPVDHWSVEVKTPIGLDFMKKYKHLF